MYYAFVINIIVVLFLCGAVIWADLSLNKKYSHYMLGIIFGLITIFVMQGRIMVVEGRFFDFRYITITMAGFIGGPVTAVMAAIITSLYRYSVGGSGTISGIANIIVFACFGSILGRQFRSRQNGKKLLFWYMIGIVMTCIYLFVIVLASPWVNDSVTVLKTISGPFLIITPLATTVIFNFYFRIREIFSKASILNTILNSSPINLMISDVHGPILHSKNIKVLCQSSQKIQELFQLQDIDKMWLNTVKQQHREMVIEDGRHFVADLSSFQVPSGEYACVAVVHDLTDRKREQEALRGANERFSKAFQFGPYMMAIIRKSDHRYVDVNRRFLEVGSFTREDVIGKTPTEISKSDPEFEEIIEVLEEHGSVQNIECSLVTKYGSVVSVILSAEKIQIDDQECILFAYNDVTEMKRIQMERVDQLTKQLTLEADLARSNQLIADIVNNMPDGFYVLDNQWRFLFLNNKVEELLLKTREELLGKVYWEAVPQARGTLIEVNYQKARNECVARTFESLSLFDKDQWRQITAYPSQFGLTVYYKDITEQKKSLEKLLKSQEEITSILESMTDCFFAIDWDFQFTYINRAGEIAFGKSREELLGKKISELEPNDATLQRYHEVMSKKRSINFEIVSEMLGNKWLEISAYPTDKGMTCYFRDITSRKKAETEIARLDRLNLVGQLAAGIGHEIRNPMTTVRGYLQLLGAKPDYSTQKPTFDLMISELDRANAIITEFLSLAQTKQTELKTQNLNDILNHLYPLIEADTFTQNKQICFIPGDIPNLELSGKEISQLVLNLIRNGLEMNEGGTVTIKTYVEHDKVVLAIEDEGCGIPLENLGRIGTPFFTTKDNGTGLGLATCYKIAESHHANIRIDSSSSGTIFYVIFPIQIGQEKNV